MACGESAVRITFNTKADAVGNGRIIIDDNYYGLPVALVRALAMLPGLRLWVWLFNRR